MTKAGRPRLFTLFYPSLGELQSRYTGTHAALNSRFGVSFCTLPFRRDTHAGSWTRWTDIISVLVCVFFRWCEGVTVAWETTPYRLVSCCPLGQVAHTSRYCFLTFVSIFLKNRPLETSFGRDMLISYTFEMLKQTHN